MNRIARFKSRAEIGPALLAHSLQFEPRRPRCVGGLVTIRKVKNIDTLLMLIRAGYRPHQIGVRLVNDQS